MKIVVIMCMWGRSGVTMLALDNLQWRRDELLRDGIELVVVACGSEGHKTRAMATSRGASYIEFSNKPVGAKFNAVLASAVGHNPAAVVVLGSDNIVNARLFREWANRIDDGVEYLGFLDGYMIDATSMRLVHWEGYSTRPLIARAAWTPDRTGEPLGSGRCFSRAFLDRAGWSLWDGRLNSGLDWSSTRIIRSYKPRSMFGRMEDFGVRHLGIKTEDNICSFDELVSGALSNVSDCETGDIAAWFGTECLDRIYAMSDKKMLGTTVVTADVDERLDFPEDLIKGDDVHG